MTTTDKHMYITKTITDLPNKIDPVQMLIDKALTCPFCKRRLDVSEDNWDYDILLRDENGGSTNTLKKNQQRYQWRYYYNCRCHVCGAEWKTDPFPVDHRFFEVKLHDESIEQELVDLMERQ